MDISLLAAKQKRFREWQEFLENPSCPPAVQSDLKQNLSRYGSLIVAIWESGSANSSQETELSHLERELEMLNESVRLRGARTMGREYDK